MWLEPQRSILPSGTAAALPVGAGVLAGSLAGALVGTRVAFAGSFAGTLAGASIGAFVGALVGAASHSNTFVCLWLRMRRLQPQQQNDSRP